MRKKDEEVFVIKNGSRYILEGDENKFAIPFVSEDGLTYYVAVQYDKCSYHLLFYADSLP